jgi:integrase
MPLALKRRPKSPYWIIRGTLRGCRVEESTGVGDRKVAEEIKAKRESEILQQSIYGRRATASFAEAAEGYLKAGGATRFLERIIKYFGTMPLAKIDQAAINQGAQRLYPKASGATRNRQFYTPVSAVMACAAEAKLCPPLILRRPPSKLPPPNWLTPSEAERLIDACTDHLRPLVIFLIYTGARAGEALWLDWQEVNLVLGQVTFINTKNGEARSVPLHRRLREALANLPHREGEVFRRPDGMPYTRPDGDNDNDQSSGTRIKTAFKSACRRAGIARNIRVHDCRHSWATWHYAVNRDLTALMALGGWKSVAMVMRYAHANVEEHRPSIERLPGVNFGDGLAYKAKKG